ncbi:hypothetical protein BaRGS_00039025 [Batillaria attramentaria]|uniref:Uncharacterized protein n=1 Tax=Batillaria attramentaria TaxID=370345 RepID=A0ABD0J4F2_9CAEN
METNSDPIPTAWDGPPTGVRETETNFVHHGDSGVLRHNSERAPKLQDCILVGSGVPQQRVRGSQTRVRDKTWLLAPYRKAIPNEFSQKAIRYEARTKCFIYFDGYLTAVASRVKIFGPLGRSRHVVSVLNDVSLREGSMTTVLTESPWFQHCRRSAVNVVTMLD